MKIREVEAGDRAEWLRMRCVLWPEGSETEHLGEIDAFLAGAGSGAVFVSERAVGKLDGFVEVSLRGVAEGASSSPVGYIEGWYVDADSRRRGVGRALVSAAEAWARARGCTEMASDTELENELSQAAHARLGYGEVGRLVHFLRPIK